VENETPSPSQVVVKDNVERKCEVQNYIEGQYSINEVQKHLWDHLRKCIRLKKNNTHLLAHNRMQNENESAGAIQYIVRKESTNESS